MSEALKVLKRDTRVVTNLHIHIDNTAAKAGIQRDYSPSFEVNSALHRLAVATKNSSFLISDVSYVNTKLNPADHPSRGRFDPAPIIALLKTLHPDVCNFVNDRIG